MSRAEAPAGATDASLRRPGTRRHRYACRSHVIAKSTGAHRNQNPFEARRRRYAAETPGALCDDDDQGRTAYLTKPLV